MTATKQVRLKHVREPLQVPYPDGYMGARSNPENDDQEIHISAAPRFLSLQEIEIVESYVSKLPYPQQIVYTGACLVGDDPLLDEKTTHEDIDKIETSQGMSSSRYVQGGGERDLRSRVYILRERGFMGNGNQALPSSDD